MTFISEYFIILPSFSFFMGKAGLDASTADRLRELVVQMQVNASALADADRAHRKARGRFETMRDEFQKILKEFLGGNLIRLRCGEFERRPSEVCGHTSTHYFEHAVLVPKGFRTGNLEVDQAHSQLVIKDKEGKAKSIDYPPGTIIGACREGDDGVYDQLMKLAPHALLEILSLYVSEK